MKICLNTLRPTNDLLSGHPYFMSCHSLIKTTDNEKELETAELNGTELYLI